MTTTRRISTVLAAALLWGLCPPTASVRGADEDHIRYSRTYGEALEASRIRGVPVIVSRHKDF